MNALADTLVMISSDADPIIENLGSRPISVIEHNTALGCVDWAEFMPRIQFLRPHLDVGELSVQLIKYLELHPRLDPRRFLNDHFLRFIRDKHVCLPHKGSLLFPGTVYNFGGQPYIRKLGPAVFEEGIEMRETRWQYMGLGFGGDEAIVLAPPDMFVT